MISHKIGATRGDDLDIKCTQDHMEPLEEQQLIQIGHKNMILN